MKYNLNLNGKSLVAWIWSAEVDSGAAGNFQTVKAAEPRGARRVSGASAHTDCLLLQAVRPAEREAGWGDLSSVADD